MGPHLRGGNVGYADGHVKWLSNGRFSLKGTGP
jgi:prepilin-type processing-associated H-X9-DG protein